MNPETLLSTNLAVVNHVVRNVCRGARIQQRQEVEDFASSVTVALMENDYAILRKWQRRGSLSGYLNVVVRRLLSNQRYHELGRWHASAEAARGGPAAVLLEKLVVRDGVPFSQAVPLVRQLDPSRSQKDLAAMAARFPQRRPQRRTVDLDAAAEVALPERDRADERVVDAEARRLSRRASEVVRRAMASWREEDITILRCRFGSSMSIVEVSRMLQIPQRPLYRRIELLLRRLRTALTAAGLDASVLGGIIGIASQEMDFGLCTSVAQ